MANKTQMEQVLAEAKDIEALIVDAEDSDKKTKALAYCDQTIAACELALEMMDGPKKKVASKENETATEDADWLD